MKTNLRHLRVFLAVADTGAVTRAAEACHVSQPAVTQAIAKLEKLAGQPLFRRSPTGLFTTHAGDVLAVRVRRALDLLDPALGDLAPRLKVTATTAQLQALIAMRETENFTLAARRMKLAQPTVHRAITMLEQEAGRPLFERRPHGVVATRSVLLLAQAARLAFAELEQAQADLAELQGREVGRIVIGAMPLSRSYILPRAIARFRKRRPTLPIRALDGPYDDMMAGLRRGEVDFLIGALRNPAPIGDVEQIQLFNDTLVMVARPGHPEMHRRRLSISDLAAYPFVVAIEGTPTRAAFDRLFRQAGATPASLVETGSMILMRELLRRSDHIGCISQLQVRAEIRSGKIAALPIPLTQTTRPIGLTRRAGWIPTKAQSEFLDDLLAALREEPDKADDDEKGALLRALLPTP
jgi:DNA-binding transcriptional LysR family regulator